MPTKNATMKTTEDILFEFTTASLQVRRLNKEIKKLSELRDIADAKAQEAFDLYHHHLHQEGREIEMPNPAQDIDKTLTLLE